MVYRERSHPNQTTLGYIITKPACHSSMPEVIEIPIELTYFQLPAAVGDRLQLLLDRQDDGETLTLLERQEAEGLVELSEFLSLLRLRSQRVAK